MAIVQRDPAIPDNIHALPSTEAELVRAHFERGDLVILTDVRIDADFDFLATLDPAAGDTVLRRDKYVFTKAVNGVRESRESKWKQFFGDAADPDIQRRAREEIRRVDEQVDAIVRKIFNRHRFSTEFIAWKFHRISGENLHIDNLPNSNDTAQVRLFMNADAVPRRWSLGQHWSHYAKRHYQAEALDELVLDPCAFNGRLNHAAFGPSWETCDEPRHLLEFEPGEVWLCNSVLVAHQVRGGNLLCSAHYEYPYAQCTDHRETLPNQIRMLAGLPVTPFNGGRPSFAARLRGLFRQSAVQARG